MKTESSDDCFKELLAVIDRLLASDGCPWDRKQTVKSLSHMLLEEVCETLDVTELEDSSNLSDELGDVFVAALFLAKAAEREKRFSWDEPMKKGREKLIRRHPHIFEKEKNLTPEEVASQWDELKKQETTHKDRKGPFDGISPSLPSLALVQKMFHIAKKHPNIFQEIEKHMKASREKEKERALCGQIASLVLEAEENGIQIEPALRKFFASCVAQ